MIKTLLKSIAIVGVIVSLATSVLAADDVLAPSWRGSTGSTTYVWDFSSADNISSPVVTGTGTGSADVILGDGGSGWTDSMLGFGTKTGLIDLGGFGSIDVNVSGAGLTDIWVQLACYYDGFFTAPEVNVIGASLVSGSSSVVEDTPPFGQWTVYQSLWTMNSGEEFGGVVFTADMIGGIVDSVVIDTRSTSVVPEPASLCALISGCSAMFLFRKKRA